MFSDPSLSAIFSAFFTDLLMCVALSEIPYYTILANKYSSFVS
jgi:hypothetical protein